MKYGPVSAREKTTRAKIQNLDTSVFHVTHVLPTEAKRNSQCDSVSFFFSDVRVYTKTNEKLNNLNKQSTNNTGQRASESCTFHQKPNTMILCDAEATGNL